EREDFRTRLKHTFESPDQPLPPIDPKGWVTSRDYMAQDFFQTVKKFLDERMQSVEWLRSLENPPWKNAHRHPRFGPLSAEMFLASWLAHDYLHVRQINRLRYHYLLHATPEVSLRYAGEW
ncbi:MAG TPA: DinB family protein, partial [Chitinophagales bacterium]|nr:DinB family protein [Chitinophagales bacterium]